jgi:hypothetical protein
LTPSTCVRLVGLPPNDPVFLCPAAPSTQITCAGGALRSRVWINDSPTSLRVLKLLGALLVDANGQHSALALKDTSKQLQLLDRLAGGGTIEERGLGDQGGREHGAQCGMMPACVLRHGGLSQHSAGLHPLFIGSMRDVCCGD